MKIELDDLELIKKLESAAQKGEVRFTDDANQQIIIKVEQGLPDQVCADFGERDPESHIFRRNEK